MDNDGNFRLLGLTSKTEPMTRLRGTLRIRPQMYTAPIFKMVQARFGHGCTIEPIRLGQTNRITFENAVVDVTG